MRVTKEYDERRNEILDTAEELFHRQGYDKCTINDILKEIGIAKGTFYHYFKSKEDVLDAIVLRYKDIVAGRAGEILKIDDIAPAEKLLRAFMAMRINTQVGDDLMEELHKAENALLHQKTLNQIVEEGIERQTWRCKYPLQYMQIFLASSLTLTDEGIFQLDADSQAKVIAALISMLEKMLDVPEGSFVQLYMQSQDGYENTNNK